MRAGFTAPEFAVLVLVIAVLSIHGVPRFVRSFERPIAMQALCSLDAVRQAQERHLSREHAYARRLIDLNLAMVPPANFRLGDLEVDDLGWSMTLTRVGAPPAGQPYTVTFNEQGYDPVSSTIEDQPELNPVDVGETGP